MQVAMSTMNLLKRIRAPEFRGVGDMTTRSGASLGVDRIPFPHSFAASPRVISARPKTE